MARVGDGVILVTGSSGHLGPWVISALTAAGHDVVALARRPAERSTIEGVRWSRPVRALACDLSRREEVEAIRPDLHAIEGAIHLAAFIPADTGRRKDEDALSTLRHGVIATVHLLEALGSASRLESLVYASTFEVYGAPERLPISEDHPTHPSGYYAAGKLAGEKYTALFGGRTGTTAVSLRLPAVYGPGDRLRRAVGNFARAAALGGEIRIEGDGTDLRDLVYVQDAATAIVEALRRRIRGVLNLGSGRGASVSEIAETAARLSGGSARIVRRDRVKPRVDYVLDSGRAREALGWSAATSLEEGMRAQVEWIRRSPAAR